jgi:hypothetical protein
MSRLVLLVSCTALVACVETAPRYRLAVPRLVDPTSTRDAAVAVAAKSFTRNTFTGSPLDMRLEWQDTATGAGMRSGPEGGLSAGAVQQFAISSADVPLLPLPAFLVRIVNDGDEPIAIGATWLTDGRGGAYRLLDSAPDLARRQREQLVLEHPSLASPGNRHILDSYMAQVAAVPLLHAGITIAAHGEWQGYVAFDLEIRDAVGPDDLARASERLTLHVRALPSAHTFELAFARPPRGTITCPDGTRHASARECANQLIEDPAPRGDGPCIQRTLKPRTFGTGTQWWMGGTPIANSDLDRTLLADVAARAQIRRGVVLRGIGYALIGAGLLGSAIAAPVLSVRFGASLGPSGLAFLSLSAAGIIVAVIGNRATDRAIRTYNVESETTGICAPVW